MRSKLDMNSLKRIADQSFIGHDTKHAAFVLWVNSVVNTIMFL